MTSVDPSKALVRRHLRFGWWTLLLFLLLGAVLEGLHAYKVSYYLDVANETRRLLWTLAHTHGTLLALVHLAFAFTARELGLSGLIGWTRFASFALSCASCLMPTGFWLGGLVIYDSDPGLGLILVPLGAAGLVVAVLWTAIISTRDGVAPEPHHEPSTPDESPIG